MYRLSVSELISVIYKAQSDIEEINAVLAMRPVTEYDFVTRSLVDAKAMQERFITAMLNEIASHPEDHTDEEAAKIVAIEEGLRRGMNTPYTGPITLAR
ncbi:hypothetical protein FHY39_19565 [Salmonella enterica]|nr:hypothetical protein [Salmonella enterica]